MKTATRVFVTVGSGLGALLTLLVAHGVLNANDASDISVIWAAIVAGWSGNVATSALQARRVPAAVPAAAGRRFGKLPAVPLAACARLDAHLSANLPAPPAALNWAARLPGLAWGMMLNDRLGDCTCAAVGHAIQLMTGISRGRVRTLADWAILRLYEAVSGYDPSTGANDHGAVVADVLARWRARGATWRRGHKIAAYGRVDQANVTVVQQVIALLGFAYVGCEVPAEWEQAPAVWDVSDSPIVGGHAVILVGWDATGFQLVSWGEVFTMTYAAFERYVDEVWGVVSADWLSPAQITPSGLNLAALLADLDALEAVA